MSSHSIHDRIFTRIAFPCGVSLDNRLVKVALYEHLADFLGGPPNDYHYSLYSKWAEFGWGMIITGNVQVSNNHLSLGRDIIIPEKLSEASIKPFKWLAASIHGSGENKVLAIMQLSHAGRQSTNFIGGRFPFIPPLAPSPIKLVGKRTSWFSSIFWWLAFQQPAAMSVKDIDDVVGAFIKGAKVAFEAGFDGIQLHAAHGYLLAQFISPKSNNREDDYSASSDNALRLVRRIVSGIRSSTSKDFVIGIKLNAADYADDVNAFNRVLDHFKAIALWRDVDFIEISGGDYENPDFMTTLSPRQALFSDFSRSAMSALESLSLGSSSPLILLTGGLRTPEVIHTALASRHSHLLGIGRMSVLAPNLPSLLRQQKLYGTPEDTDPRWSTPFHPEPNLEPSSLLHFFLPSIPLIGAGVNMAWYTVTLRRLTTKRLSTNMKDAFLNLESDYSLGPIGAVFWMWIWLDCAHLSVYALLSLAVCILAVSALVLI